MKKILGLVLILFISCNNTQQHPNDNKQELTGALALFDEESLDFGKVIEEEKVNLVYRFTNKGTSPMIIYEVKPGCGCTTVKSPEKPIGINKRDSIQVTFNTKHKVGIHDKYIVVFYNCIEKAKILSFKGEVESRVQ